VLRDSLSEFMDDYNMPSLETEKEFYRADSIRSIFFDAYVEKYFTTPISLSGYLNFEFQFSEDELQIIRDYFGHYSVFVMEPTN
jgi:hypothetical protein